MNVLLGIPINRVVAFCGPAISLVAGGASAFLVARVNVLGVPGLDQANVATWLTAGGTLALGAGLTWLGHQKWLTGHQIDMVTTALAKLPSGAIAEEARSVVLSTLARNLPKAVRAEVAAVTASGVNVVNYQAPAPIGNAAPTGNTAATGIPPTPLPIETPVVGPPPTTPDEDDSVHAATDADPGAATLPELEG